MRRRGTDIGRKRGYFVLMGICLALFILAWAVVRNYSTTAAIIMSAAAVLIPPVAAMVANAGDEQRPRR
jgi:formate hydrogenlyase subunit 4